MPCSIVTEQSKLLQSVSQLYWTACERGDESVFLNELYKMWFMRYPVREEDPAQNTWVKGFQKVVRAQ